MPTEKTAPAKSTRVHHVRLQQPFSRTEVLGLVILFLAQIVLIGLTVYQVHQARDEQNNLLTATRNEQTRLLESQRLEFRTDVRRTVYANYLAAAYRADALVDRLFDACVKGRTQIPCEDGQERTDARDNVDELRSLNAGMQIQAELLVAGLADDVFVNENAALDALDALLAGGITVEQQTTQMAAYKTARSAADDGIQSLERASADEIRANLADSSASGE